MIHARCRMSANPEDEPMRSGFSRLGRFSRFGWAIGVSNSSTTAACATTGSAAAAAARRSRLEGLAGLASYSTTGAWLARSRAAARLVSLAASLRSLREGFESLPLDLVRLARRFFSSTVSSSQRSWEAGSGCFDFLARFLRLLLAPETSGCSRSSSGLFGVKMSRSPSAMNSNEKASMGLMETDGVGQ